MDFRKLILGSALVVATLPAVANDEDRGFYAGSGAGMYFIDIDGVGFDESAATLRVFGGYRVSQYFSVEAGYTNLFESSASMGGVDVDVDGNAWDLSVRPTLPVSDRFEVFGVLGYTRYDFDMKASFQGISASDSDSDSNLLYGLGAGMDLTPNWNLRGEWTMVDVDDADLSMMAVSATYRFQ